MRRENALAHSLAIGFLDMDIDAPTPEGECPGFAPVKRRERTTTITQETKLVDLRRKHKEEEQNRKWAEVDKLLGKVPDADIAKRFGVGKTTVGDRRKKLKIPSFGLLGRTDWKKFDGLLGTMPDRELASLIGCKAETVAKRRISFEIERFDVEKREKKR